MTRSILSYVEIFTDPRKLPRIEMELILRGSEICFSPSISEVSEMILSVVFEVSNSYTILNTFSSYLQHTMRIVLGEFKYSFVLKDEQTATGSSNNGKLDFWRK